ncbi:efflux RND transporter periplasmic adaptor subunit [Caenimonas koreensis]|uniref:Efflux RND transporter periplasmic adaptor subunit n=1 Tax=Caenimonas koreensis DSM 17982 TaxID=1121255 RepID=A0A844BEG0_9BURK|nr:efflux RND transporter periplasmic adaptor subunit [Caenimonas koreensis]MRD48841.1 efflux RND transporter periplasmic adaptor subunit [Caenimonas koreensis DSM 17982]
MTEMTTALPTQPSIDSRPRVVARRPVAAWAVAGVVLVGAVLLAIRAFAPSTAPVAQTGSAAQDLPALQVAIATAAGGSQTAAFDGLVQAVRQTSVAAQVSGAVVAIEVKAGDTVRAGQVLLRIDARAAQQTAAAATAQVGAARAEQEVATRELERQRALFKQNFISQAALDRAEAQYKSTVAGAASQLASAGAANTQTDFHVLRAPYDGVVAEVAAVVGDMAMPGRALMTVYDPRALRVSAAVPESAAAALAPGQLPQVEIRGAQPARVVPLNVQVLPAVDPASHTLEVRLDLPAGSAVRPGMFARIWMPLTVEGAPARLFIPSQALWRQGELTAVYVVGEGGRALLRQVRVGRAEGERTEVLAGISAGERVALDPQAAAQRR